MLVGNSRFFAMTVHKKSNLLCSTTFFQALDLESPNTHHQFLVQKGFVCFCFLYKLCQNSCSLDKCRVILGK